MGPYKTYRIKVCVDCLNLKGEQCCDPGCVFIRYTMREVREFLDMLMIAPVIDGQRYIFAESDADVDPAS